MPRRRFPITLTLTASIGALVLLAVGAVLWIEWTASRQILATLGGRVVERNVSLIERGIERHLEPARRQVESLGRWIESGDYGLDEPERLADLLTGAVAAAPQIGALVVAGTEGRALRLIREPDGGCVRVERVDPGSLPAIAAAIEDAAGRSLRHIAEVLSWRDQISGQKTATLAPGGGAAPRRPCRRADR